MGWLGYTVLTLAVIVLVIKRREVMQMLINWKKNEPARLERQRQRLERELELEKERVKVREARNKLNKEKAKHRPDNGLGMNINNQTNKPEQQEDWFRGMR